MVQANLVLARTTMPHRKRTLAARLQMLPQLLLVTARKPPVVRKRDLRHGRTAATVLG
jgi:hypothetical protein